MTVIEISELNGKAGNLDFWQKSRDAEHQVLTCVSRLLQRPIHETPGKGKHPCDFMTSQGFMGDVKIWSGSTVKVELMQIHKGIRKPGWYQEYQKLSQFGGLIALNYWWSDFHDQGVFKIRWIPWQVIQQGVNQSKMCVNQRGAWCELDPTQGEHYWLGDFMESPTKYPDKSFRAFDSSRIHANNKLNILDLYKWF